MISEVTSRKQMNHFKQWEKSSNCVAVFPLESKESDFIGSTLGIIDPQFFEGWHWSQEKLNELFTSSSLHTASSKIWSFAL